MNVQSGRCCGSGEGGDPVRQRSVRNDFSWPVAGAPVRELDATLLTFKMRKLSEVVEAQLQQLGLR